MFGSTQRAIGAYRQIDKQARVASASPHHLITLLLEAALVVLAQARRHMEERDIAAKGAALGKAIAILQEGLIPALDRDAGGDLAQNLHDLYQYMTHRLLLANLRDDVAAVIEVGDLLRGLKQAWDAIDEGAVTRTKEGRA